VGWNGYDRDQRGAVWARLLDLRAGATRHLLEVIDAAALREAARPAAAEDQDLHLLAYELLRQHAGADQPAQPVLARLGLRVVDQTFPGAVEDLLRLIDLEFHQRSVAQYERNFRTPAE